MRTLSWGMWDPSSLIRDQTWPLHWECRVLATGPPGKSLQCFLRALSAFLYFSFSSLSFDLASVGTSRALQRPRREQHLGCCRRVAGRVAGCRWVGLTRRLCPGSLCRFPHLLSWLRPVLQVPGRWWGCQTRSLLVSAH